MFKANKATECTFKNVYMRKKKKHVQFAYIVLDLFATKDRPML